MQPKTKDTGLHRSVAIISTMEGHKEAKCQFCTCFTHLNAAEKQTYKEIHLFRVKFRPSGFCIPPTDSWECGADLLFALQFCGSFTKSSPQAEEGACQISPTADVHGFPFPTHSHLEVRLKVLYKLENLSNQKRTSIIRPAVKYKL